MEILNFSYTKYCITFTCEACIINIHAIDGYFVNITDGLFNNLIGRYYSEVKIVLRDIVINSVTNTNKFTVRKYVEIFTEESVSVELSLHSDPTGDTRGIMGDVEVEIIHKEELV